jgi:hypothetical protein
MEAPFCGERDLRLRQEYHLLGDLKADLINIGSL